MESVITKARTIRKSCKPCVRNDGESSLKKRPSLCEGSPALRHLERAFATFSRLVRGVRGWVSWLLGGSASKGKCKCRKVFFSLPFHFWVRGWAIKFLLRLFRPLFAGLFFVFCHTLRAAACPECGSLASNVVTSCNASISSCNVALGHLNSATSYATSARSEINNAYYSLGEVDQSNLSSHDRSLISSTKNSITAARGYCDVAINTYNNVQNELIATRTRTQSLLDQALLFNCNCTTNCPCVDWLSRIYSECVSINNYVSLCCGIVDDISVDASSLVSISSEISTNVQSIVHRMNVPDDDYRTGINVLLGNIQAASLTASNLDYPLSLVSSFFSSPHQFHIGNEGVALSTLLGVLYAHYVESYSQRDAILNTMTNFAFHVTNVNQVAIDNNVNVTNMVDVSWITNYLDQVQANYFRRFNALLGDGRTVTLNPFGLTAIDGKTYSPFVYASNFWNSLFSLSGTRSSRVAYHQYRLMYTNWFDRIEFGLYGLAGLFGRPGATNYIDEAAQEGYESTDLNNPSSAASTALLDNVPSAKTSLENVKAALSSTPFEDAYSSFRRMVGAFSFEDLAPPSFVPILDEFDFAGIEFPALNLDTSQFMNVIEFCRFCFTLIWRVLFVCISLPLLYKLFVACGKAISHIFVIIKTLL